MVCMNLVGKFSTVSHVMIMSSVTTRCLAWLVEGSTAFFWTAAVACKPVVFCWMLACELSIELDPVMACVQHSSA